MSNLVSVDVVPFSLTYEGADLKVCNGNRESTEENESCGNDRGSASR
jgi:hypothetical protein